MKIKKQMGIKAFLKIIKLIYSDKNGQEKAVMNRTCQKENALDNIIFGMTNHDRKESDT